MAGAGRPGRRYGYTLGREACGQANGLTDPAARSVRVRPDVPDAQAVKTPAQELAHIECGHTADGFDYRAAGAAACVSDRRWIA